jgi:hypothetical protein
LGTIIWGLLTWDRQWEFHKAELEVSKNCVPTDSCVEILTPQYLRMCLTWK